MSVGSSAGRVRHHIRSNVVAYVALFLLLAGGTASVTSRAHATHPSGANTISSLDIINGTITAPDVGAEAVTAGGLAANSIDSRRVSANAARGAHIVDSTLELGAAGWNEVGDGDGPPFTPYPSLGFTQVWANFDGVHHTVAFRRDQTGFVHLKGLVRFTPVPDCFCVLAHDAAIPWEVFTLPLGFRPAARESQITLQQGRLAGIEVHASGQVILDLIGADMGKGEWASLDTITFRCAPSGSNGCP